MYRHETEIYNLRRINKLLIYKVNSLKLNDKNERSLFNFCKNSKFAEDDSALDSISNLDNTSEYDDDFDIDNTYFKVKTTIFTLHFTSQIIFFSRIKTLMK